MNIDLLTRIVMVQRKTTTINEFNEEVPTWVDHQKQWASVVYTPAKERFAADRDLATYSAKITIRWMAIDIHEHRISYDGKIFEIVGVAEDKSGRREMLELVCEAKV